MAEATAAVRGSPNSSPMGSRPNSTSPSHNNHHHSLPWAGSTTALNVPTRLLLPIETSASTTTSPTLESQQLHQTREESEAPHDKLIRPPPPKEQTARAPTAIDPQKEVDATDLGEARPLPQVPNGNNGTTDGEWQEERGSHLAGGARRQSTKMISNTVASRRRRNPWLLSSVTALPPPQMTSGGCLKARRPRIARRRMVSIRRRVDNEVFRRG